MTDKNQCQLATGIQIKNKPDKKNKLDKVR